MIKMSNNKRSALCATLLFLFAVTLLISSARGATTGPDEEHVPGKIALRVLYAGHPGSEREKDFVTLLERHFKNVGKTDLKTFAEKQAEDFDVVIMDYDGRCFDAPRPDLSNSYTRATVTVAGVGALIGGSLRLKTDYT